MRKNAQENRQKAKISADKMQAEIPFRAKKGDQK